MDPVLIAVYAEMLSQHGCSSEDILYKREFREEFLSNCRRATGTDCGEEATLRRLGTLRKQSKLPRAADVRRPPTDTRPEAN